MLDVVDTVVISTSSVKDAAVLYNICVNAKMEKLEAGIVPSTEVEAVTLEAESDENVVCFFSAWPNVK